MIKLKYIGQSTTRLDGKAKVSGAAQFVDDVNLGPNTLYAAIVESTRAHAKIKKIDTAEAQKVPGVLKVVMGKDFPYHFGLYMHDRYIFAQDRVRFVGEQVAAVIARDPKIAKKAAKLVKVDYEDLPYVLNVEDSLKEKPTLIHPDLGKYTHVPWFFPQAKTNIAHLRKVRRGDVEKAFNEADLVFEDTYTMPRYVHCSIEYHGAAGLYDHEGRLTVWASSQAPHTLRHLFAEALKPLGLTHKGIRVLSTFVGGGFGGKAGVTMEILAAALAMQVRGNPIKVMWSRQQEFYNTYHRQGVVAKIKMGVKKDGTITAIDRTIYWDAGAYVEYGANVVNAAGLSAAGPYNIPNVKIDSVCVYTNLPPSGAYRGFGYSEILFGLESHIDQIAKKLNIDPVEMRKRNAIKEGDMLAYGCKMNPCNLQEAIDKVAKEIGWGKKETPADPNKAIGLGFALLWKAPAMPPNASSSAFIKFNEDGSLNLIVSAMELGQGYQTVMAQIAAEVLTIPPEKIRVETPDTDRNPYEWQTVASHITWSCGNAVKIAAEDVREQIFALIERALGKNKEDLYLEDEKVKSKKEPKFELAIKDFIIDGIAMKDGTYRGGPIMGRGAFMPEFSSALSNPETSQGGHPNVHYTVGAGATKIEIDKQTGKIKILKGVLAIDAGKAINPDLVRGQIIGGLLQGYSTALYEDIRFDDKGKLLNPNFTDYKIPTAMDEIENLVPIIVETPQPDGPFGARGIGEHTMIACAPMIANAIDDALGLRIKSAPMTAEKITKYQ